MPACGVSFAYPPASAGRYIVNLFIIGADKDAVSYTHLDVYKRQLHAHTGEGVGQHVLELSHDVVLLDKAHLDVDLGELGLAVGAQIRCV